MKRRDFRSLETTPRDKPPLLGDWQTWREKLHEEENTQKEMCYRGSYYFMTHSDALSLLRPPLLPAPSTLLAKLWVSITGHQRNLTPSA